MKYFMATLITALITASIATSAQAHGPWTDNFNQPQDPSVTEEARPFIIKRQGCNHFRGEPPYDEERKKFLLEQIAELCAGSDAELKRLRTKYAGHPETIKALAEFENCIEYDTGCETK